MGIKNAFVFELSGYIHLYFKKFNFVFAYTHSECTYTYIENTRRKFEAYTANQIVSEI